MLKKKLALDISTKQVTRCANSLQVIHDAMIELQAWCNKHGIYLIACDKENRNKYCQLIVCLKDDQKIEAVTNGITDTSSGYEINYRLSLPAYR